MLHLSAGAALVAACATNPATGKSEISLVSEGQEIEMGNQMLAAARATLDPGIWWGSFEVPVLLQVALVAASALILLFAAVKLFARTE